MYWIKIILINIILTFAFLGMILIAPPIVYSLYNIIKSGSSDFYITDKRSLLKLYTNYDWVEQHFIEFSDLPRGPTQKRLRVYHRPGLQQLFESMRKHPQCDGLCFKEYLNRSK